MSKIRDFDGIYVRAGTFCINTLSGHFVKIADGCDNIADSLSFYLNNSPHSISEVFCGRLSILQSAIITALEQSKESGGLTLKEIANRVYKDHAKLQHPERAISNAMSSIRYSLSKRPKAADVFVREHGKFRLTNDPSLEG